VINGGDVLQVCFNQLYGVTLCFLQSAKKVDYRVASTKKVLELFRPLLISSFLANVTKYSPANA
jgi:hypothetical protein